MKNDSITIGDWLLLPETRRLVKNDTEIKIEPKVVDVLLCLVRHQGQVVRRDFLMNTIWQDAVVNEDSLNRIISKLRKIFDDDPSHPSYIETLSKSGYRLVASVRIETDGAHQETESQWTGRTKKSTPKMIIPLTVITVALITLWIVFNPMSQNSDQMDQVRLAPLTSSPGHELNPSFSPDGNHIVYVQKHPDQQSWDLFVKQIGHENSQQITNDGVRKRFPTFSPDGRSIAYYKSEKNNHAIYFIPVIGGRERKVVDILSDRIHSLDWAPDGESLVFSDNPSVGSPKALCLVSVYSRQKQFITGPDPSILGDAEATFSPSGDYIAFTRRRALGNEAICIFDLNVENVQYLSKQNQVIHGLDWMNQDESIVFSSNRSGDFGLWAMPIQGEYPNLIGGGITSSEFPSVAPVGNRIAFEKWTIETNVYRISIDPKAPCFGEMNPVIVSTRIDRDAQIYSPNGQIAFVSDRSGNREIWLCEKDGSRPTQLTRFKGPIVGMPHWTPKGDIIFTSWAEGHADIYRISTMGGTAARLTDDTAEDIVTHVSEDGEFVTFASNRTGDWQIWKMNLQDETHTQVTSNGGYDAIESPIDQLVYYVRSEDNAIWRTGQGHKPERIVGGLDDLYASNWTIGQEGIYYIKNKIEDGPTLWMYHFQSGESTEILALPKLYYKSGLCLSEDEEAIYFTQLDRNECDIMMLEYQ